MLISPTCPICRPYGVIRLGRPALLRYEPQVVSRAIEYSLELQAQASLAAKPINLEQGVQDLKDMMATLTRSGLVGVLEPGQPAATVDSHSTLSEMTTHRQAVALAEEASGLTYEPGTAAILQAPPIPYDGTTIKVDGFLTPFGAAGFLAGITQILDPIHPLDVKHRDPAESNRMGEVLGRAVVGRKTAK